MLILSQDTLNRIAQEFLSWQISPFWLLSFSLSLALLSRSLALSLSLYLYIFVTQLISLSNWRPVPSFWLCLSIEESLCPRTMYPARRICKPMFEGLPPPDPDPRHHFGNSALRTLHWIPEAELRCTDKTLLRFPSTFSPAFLALFLHHYFRLTHISWSHGDQNRFLSLLSCSLLEFLLFCLCKNTPCTMQGTRRQRRLVKTNISVYIICKEHLCNKTINHYLCSKYADSSVSFCLLSVSTILNMYSWCSFT